MKKIKVLQFTIAASFGGRTQYVLNNWKNIDKNKFHFDFITFSKELDFAKELIAQGCKVYYISCYPEENKKQFIKELDAILDNGYDVIHIHTSYWRSFIVEERAKVKNIEKIIIHSHGIGINKAVKKSDALMLSEEHYLIREMIDETLADEFLACSKNAAMWLYADKIPEKKIKIVHNAIDIEKFRYNFYTRNDYREKMDWNGKFVIGQVARFVYPKNHKFMLEVFENVHNKIPSAALVLVGDGELKEEIKTEIDRRNLSAEVYLVGKRKDVNCLMQAMDMLVLPSLYEALGMVLIEAQTSGLPCLASADNTSDEAKVTNLLEFEELDVDKWTNKICEIYKKNINKTVRADRCEEVRLAGYDIRSSIKEIENIYQGID